jgi:arabinogalactan endo-1,4-beta-galactosidase
MKEIRKIMPVLKLIIITLLFNSYLFAVTKTDSVEFIKGADISFLAQIEDLGGVYNDNATPQDALQIFKDHDFNYFRLKLWHTPAENYNNLEKVLYMAKRIKEKNLKLLLNFHYSDTWADPAHQTKPKAWNGLSFEVLKDSVYQYTKKVIGALCAQQTIPDMVQLGNEITPGMLWNDGRVGGNYNNWKQLGELIQSGIRGVRESCAAGDSVRIMIHIDRGGDNGGSRWFFDNLNKQNVPFDVIGLSFYPWWHGILNQLKSNLNDLATRYGKDLVVVETAYPWTLQWFDSRNNIVGDAGKLHAGYPASIAGQTQFLKDLISIIRNVKNEKGLGLFYWEPEYISVQPIGSPWENLALFDFNGNALTSMDAFLEQPAEVMPRQGMNRLLPTQLQQNYPNPFNDQTRIEYTLDNFNFVTLKIYDLQGKLVATLVECEQLAGNYSVPWQARQQDGTDVASGIYLIQLKTGLGIETRKTLFLK